VDTTSNCPLDTTSYEVVYDCGTLGIEKPRPTAGLSLYPNPATESITVELPPDISRGEIRIYNTAGVLVKRLKADPVTQIDISALPRGLYFIRLKNQRYKALKFIKN
jgi:hypothetical protein